MNNLILSVFLFLAVVCPMQAQRVMLPVGEQAVTEYVWRTAGTEGRASVALEVATENRSVGAVPAVVSSVSDVQNSLSGMQFRPGNPDQEYFVQVDTYVGGGTNVGSRLIFKSQPFKLVDGKIPISSVVFPSETDIACKPSVGIYGSTVAVWAPDVRWVEYGYTFPDLDLTPQITRNGWATNCWASELFGNGYIYIDGWVLSGNRLKWIQAVDGPDAGEYVTIWYDEDRAVGDRWDIGTGQWTAVGYSPAPKMALRFDKDGNILVGATGGTPGTTYAIGVSASLGGSETVIGTSTAGYDGAIAVYTPFDRTASARFFTIRPSRAGDPSPQPTAVPLGASFP
jgi:hypothetical protein